MNVAATPSRAISRVLVVEDLAESRRWMAELCRAAFDGCAVVEVEGVRAALAACDGAGFDLALVDLRLPDGSGETVLRHLRDVAPATIPVVATVMASDSAIVGALSAGAQGYILKGEPEERVTTQLRLIADGEPALSPRIARRVMDHFRLTGPSAEPEAILTGRERDVLSLIARGQRVADCALVLGIAESTVATHVKSIYRKLDISNRAEAAMHAARLGLIQSPDGRRG